MSLSKYFRSNSNCSDGTSNNNKERRLAEEKVFHNPVILQVILKHVLQKEKTNKKGEETLCTKSAKRLRLVSRAWLLETNLLFRKAGQPLVLLTAQNFQSFLTSTQKGRTDWVPPLSLSLSLVTFAIKCISMPRTITLATRTTPRDLATLVHRRSDILEEMRVLKFNVITENDLLNLEDVPILFRCLNQGASSLEELSLEIKWAIFRRNRDLKIALNFPRMRNLKRMKIFGKTWRLDENNMQDDLGAKLPKLEELDLWTTGGDLFFEEWCRHSVFWNVTSLKIYMLTDIGNDISGVSRRFPKEDIEQVRKTFPRVVHLSLGVVHPEELDGVKCLFGNMGQLKSLKLNIIGRVESKEEIEGLIIGARPTMVKVLMEGDSELWGRFLEGDLEEAGIPTNAAPSIRDLKNLELLVLHGELFLNIGGEHVKNLASDLSFDLGYLQLPALDRLEFKGSFGVSEEMADKWCKQKKGRKIEYIKEKPENANGRVWFRHLIFLVFEIGCVWSVLYSVYLVKTGEVDMQFKDNDTWGELLFKIVVHLVLSISWSIALRFAHNFTRRIFNN